MRHGRYSAALFTVVLLHGCGGNDSPTAPTGGAAPTPTPTPIVVTVTAQVVDNAALQGVRSFDIGPTIEDRDLRVIGNVDVFGGTATLRADLFYTFTPDGNQPPVTEEVVIFPDTTIGPGGTPFDIVFGIPVPPGTSTAGTTIVEVTGIDGNGDVVAVSSNILPVADSNTKKPASPCMPDANTLCALQDGRFKVHADWRDFDGNTGQAIVTDGQRFSDGGWYFFSGSSAGLDPNGFDVFVQLLDRCSNNNNFWVFANGNTDVEVTLTVTDTQTNQTTTYFNPLGMASPAITDTSAFATCP